MDHGGGWPPCCILLHMPSPNRPSRNRRNELQAALGDLGIVLPRQDHGTPARRAQGWYAELHDGTVAFLGDYAALAVSECLKLREKAGLA